MSWDGTKVDSIHKPNRENYTKEYSKRRKNHHLVPQK